MCVNIMAHTMALSDEGDERVLVYQVHCNEVCIQLKIGCKAFIILCWKIGPLACIVRLSS